MKNTVAIILAAGEGTRFKSETPKVLHKIFGKMIIERVIEIIDGFDKKIIVVGHKSELVKKSISPVRDTVSRCDISNRVDYTIIFCSGQ